MDEKYTDFWKGGEYLCSKCGNKLFESNDKFKSGTIWPSFRKTALPGSVAEKEDLSHGMVRTEVVCSKCGEHLGHVFPDGHALGDKDPEAGLRYCILSDCLDFKEGEKGESK